MTRVLLIAPNNSINAYANNNTLVITDYADNLARLERIIDALDTPYGEGPQVIPIRHASAIDLATMLSGLYGAASGAPGDSSQRVSILADSRANSLIVSSDNPGKVARIRALIATLDQPTAAAGNIHVIYLKNADAAGVARTLRAIVTGEAPSPLPSASLSSTPTAGTAAATGALRTAQLAAAQPPGATPGGLLTGGGFIPAGTAHHALIITAPDPVYNNLRRVVDMLDKRRAQVYIEALIVELQSDRASEFGIQWQNQPGAESRRYCRNDRRRCAQSRCACALSGDRGEGEYSFDTEHTDPGQRGSQDPGRQQRPVHHRPICANGRLRNGNAVPDLRSERRGNDAEDQTADFRRRHRAHADIPGIIQHPGSDVVEPRRPAYQQALHRIHGCRGR